jgi:hypothetical protein
MIVTIKVEPFIRKREQENYITQISVDQDALNHENGTSIITLTTKENLNIDCGVNSKDLYQLALLIVNTYEIDDNN